MAERATWSNHTTRTVLVDKHSVKHRAVSRVVSRRDDQPGSEVVQGAIQRLPGRLTGLIDEVLSEDRVRGEHGIGVGMVRRTRAW
jgi:hypothetical protein